MCFHKTLLSLKQNKSEVLIYCIKVEAKAAVLECSQKWANY